MTPQRLRQTAALVPLLGLALLLPPLIALFTLPLTLGGVPLIVLYLFALWAVLIGAAAWLARRLDDADAGEPGG